MSWMQVILFGAFVFGAAFFGTLAWFAWRDVFREIDRDKIKWR